MIGIICITATLVFDERKSADRVSMHRTLDAATAPCLGYTQSARSASWSGNVAAHKSPIAKGMSGLRAAEATGRRQDGDGKT